MERMIKVHLQGSSGIITKEVTLQEAEKILKDTYADPRGGLVSDHKTGEIIWEIGPNVEEVFIIDHMIGGG